MGGVLTSSRRWTAPKQDAPPAVVMGGGYARTSAPPSLVSGPPLIGEALATRACVLTVVRQDSASYVSVPIRDPWMRACVSLKYCT
jgi:hypothetical protein